MQDMRKDEKFFKLQVGTIHVCSTCGRFIRYKNTFFDGTNIISFHLSNKDHPAY
jgi:hypothetical protein